MTITLLNTGFLVLIAQLTVSIRHRFEIKMQLKELIFLKSQKNVYQIEKVDSKFIFGVNTINKPSIAL